MNRHYKITTLCLSLAAMLSICFMVEAQLPLLSVQATALYSINNMPPLYKAAIAGDKARVTELISQGVDLNEQLPTSGATALDGAVVRGRHEIVQELVAAGARKDIANNEGKTPLDVAKELDRADIIPLLQ